MRLIFFLLCICSVFFAEEKTTFHTLSFPSGTISYTATVGSLPTFDSKGAPIGQIGYIAYIQSNPSTQRPLTFAFNGGPGSSSAWLHMGTFGPYRVQSPQDAGSTTAPYTWVENPETLLDVTDLVFIDPMGTGFSQAPSFEEAKTCYGLYADIRCLGDFVRDFLTVHKRWNSPKYLAGESYGTLRALGLCEYLQETHSIYLNGLILVSCAIDYQGFVFQEDNWLPYLCFFPTYATTAWHYGKYRPEATLEEVAEEARLFAYETLAPSLYHFRSLSEESKEELYEKISSFTSLPLQTVRRYQGRITDECFLREFLADQQKIIGRFDTQSHSDTFPSYTLPFHLDPSYTQIEGPFAAAIQDYLQTKLEVSGSYKLLSMEVNRHWDFQDTPYWGYPNRLNSLRKSLLSHPSLKIFMGCGYYDAATPFFATEYCFEQLRLPPSYDSQFQIEYYSGGHMYYLQEKERMKFKKDLVRFYE